MQNRRPMRRTLTAVAGVFALSLSLSAIVAQADAHGFGRGWHHGFFGRNAIVTGTVTSVGNGSFGANAYVLTPGAGGGGASTATTPVTITEGSNTKVVVLGQSGITVGDTFYATYRGESSTTPITTLVTGTPSKIFATVQAPSTLYAFVGTVTGTDTASSPETVSVNVTESTPTGLFTGTDTFDVGPGTFVFGGPGGSLFGSLSNVSTGDVVAGGLVSTGGQTASAIEADPLEALVDFPASSSSSSSPAALRHVRREDLKKAMKLLRKDRIRLGGAKHKKH